MSFDFSAFDHAVNAFYGSISGLLEKECGCRIVGGSSTCVSLVCPNHGDTPKNLKGYYLHANDEKGAWHCFKCENEGSHIAHGGYAVDAIMEYRHMDRKEAFRYLAEKVGFKSNADYAYRDEEIRSMYVNACHELFMKGVAKSPYKEAAGYLAGRGFRKEVIRRHRIGFVSGFDAIGILRKKGIDNDRLEKAGILNRSKRTGNLYPAFMNRVVMMTGDNIYGRSIDPETTLRHFYTKSHNSVFNEMDLGKERDVVFIVEAAFDALTIEQYIREIGANWCVVATCGTKGIKIEELVKKLKGAMPAEVILVPDADPWHSTNRARHAAGQRAGLAKARALEAEGFRTRIVVLPDNSDPNDLSKKKVSAVTFEEMVGKAISPAKFAVFCEAHYHALGEHSGNIGFLNAVRKSLAKYKIALSSEILDYLALLTGEEVTEIRRFMNPSLKESDALDFIRTQIQRGLSIEAVLNGLKARI